MHTITSSSPFFLFCAFNTCNILGTENPVILRNVINMFEEDDFFKSSNTWKGLRSQSAKRECLDTVTSDKDVWTILGSVEQLHAKCRNTYASLSLGDTRPRSLKPG